MAAKYLKISGNGQLGLKWPKMDSWAENGLKRLEMT